MKIMPALDLLHGKLVRLYQGSFENIQSYSDSPQDIADTFIRQGFSSLHVIDLDGAKAGQPLQCEIIHELLKKKAFIQVGGGIRNKDEVKNYLENGASRVIVSTCAILEPTLWNDLVCTFGKERLALSLDVKDGKVAIHGWKDQVSITIHELIQKLNPLHLIVTDTSRDGTLSGPNLALYQTLTAAFGHVNLIAAGGIRTFEDIQSLKQLGIQEVIVGRAFYEQPQFKSLLEINWKKVGGLLPAIVQSAEDKKVLMLGYMNQEALLKTISTNKVSFFSRTRQALWTKGETSGNELIVQSLDFDCDKDALLVHAIPTGPTCHRGTKSCFDDADFLTTLSAIIDERFKGHNPESYVFRLSQRGASRIAQKVGEEAVETAIASVLNDKNQMKEESADLLFHFLVNLRFHQISLDEIVTILEKRHGKTDPK